MRPPFGLSLRLLRLPGRELVGHLAPLLAKELIEIAARPRSYVLRVVFAAALFALYAMQFHAQLAGAEAGDLAVLGSGKRMLDTLVGALFAAIYLLVPAMVAPAVLAEREAGTLEVLLVSRLQPWQLLAQKLLSRSVAMAGFLVIALPLSGIAYSLGGLGAGELLAAALALTCGTLQVGAWSLYCGARARNALGGVMRAYVLGVAALFILVPLALVPVHIAAALVRLDIGWASSYPLGIYFGSSAMSPLTVLAACVPTLLSAGVLFLTSCRAVEFDETWTSGPVVALVTPRERRARAVAGDLPGDRPVAWREGARLRRWLRGTYLAWFVGGMGVVIVIGIAALARTGEARSTDSDACAFLVMVASLVAAAAIAGHASALASEERARGTLEILLATPIEPRDIVAEKLAGSRLLARLLLAGVATLCLAEAALEIGMGVGRALLYFTASVGTLWLYLEGAAWLGMAIGLRSRAPAAAALGTIGTLLVWTVVPTVVVHWLADEGSTWWSLLSPARMIELDEYPPELATGLGTWIALLAINALWIGGITLALRWWCLRGAAQLRERPG